MTIFLDYWSIVGVGVAGVHHDLLPVMVDSLTVPGTVRSRDLLEITCTVLIGR